MYSGLMTFQLKEHEDAPGEPNTYYYEHTYFLEKLIELV